MNKKVENLLKVCLVAVMGVVLLTACPAQKTACQVIRAANTVCTVIEYVGDDGKTYQVPVSQEELQGFARTTAAKRVATPQK